MRSRAATLTSPTAGVLLVEGITSGSHPPPSWWSKRPFGSPVVGLGCGNDGTYLTFRLRTLINVLGLRLHRWWKRETGPKHTERTLARFSARSLTDLSTWLAGPNRLALRDEWPAHLGGESGHDLVTWPKVRQALGFVKSAVQFRLADAADAAWTPADAILKSRKLSNLVVFGPTALAALFILLHLGTLGAMTSAESIVAIGGALYGLVRVGRWYRDVKPPEPKARRAGKSLADGEGRGQTPES